jgi:SAM-dependent methyltransferase
MQKSNIFRRNPVLKRVAVALKRLTLVNSSRYYLEQFNRRFAQSMVPGSMILDAGAGNAPYKSLFKHVRYESADFEKVDKPYASSTYVCDLCDRIPVEDGRYDYIVINQVLEHLANPGAALAELSRVLKRGGRMLVSAPLFYEEHERPFDYYRYTQFAYGQMFSRAGLAVDSIERLEGYFGTIAYMFECVFRHLPLLPSRKRAGVRATAFLVWPLVVFTKLWCFLLACVFYRLDMKYKLCDMGFPKNYVAMAHKPAAPPLAS